MVNVTISVTEELKARMDRWPDTNWSKVCREAIDTYIKTLENPIPQVEATLKEAKCDYEKGKPGLRLTLRFRNNMKTTIRLDRILYDVNFIPTPGTKISAGSDVYLRKKSFIAGSTHGIQPFMEIDADRLLKIDESITRSFQCNVELVSFFEGFRDPYVVGLETLIPYDFWRYFIERVLKNEKESLEIRNKRILGTK